MLQKLEVTAMYLIPAIQLSFEGEWYLMDTESFLDAEYTVSLTLDIQKIQ